MDQKTESRLRAMEEIIDELCLRVDKLENNARERFGEYPYHEFEEEGE